MFCKSAFFVIKNRKAIFENNAYHYSIVVLFIGQRSFSYLLDYYSTSQSQGGSWSPICFGHLQSVPFGGTLVTKWINQSATIDVAEIY